MELRILGCSGGASSRHRQVSFLVDGRLALDAGSLAAALSLEEQARLETVLVSHAHMDHIADLGPLSDLRCQGGGPPLDVLGSRATIDALRRHLFNEEIWPDFTRIPSAAEPTVRLQALEPEVAVAALDYLVTPIPVHHAVPTSGFLLQGPRASLAYSADTGPTQRFWQAARETPGLAAVITEVSLPDRLAELAGVSGHMTTRDLAGELAKLDRPEVPILVYGLKPSFEAEIQGELEALAHPGLRVLAGGERMLLEPAR